MYKLKKILFVESFHPYISLKRVSYDNHQTKQGIGSFLLCIKRLLKDSHPDQANKDCSQYFAQRFSIHPF